MNVMCVMSARWHKICPLVWLCACVWKDVWGCAMDYHKSWYVSLFYDEHTLNVIHLLAAGIHSPLFMTCCCKGNLECVRCVKPFPEFTQTRMHASHLYSFFFVYSKSHILVFVMMDEWMIQIMIAELSCRPFVYITTLFFCVDLYCSNVYFNKWSGVSYRPKVFSQSSLFLWRRGG